MGILLWKWTVRKRSNCRRWSFRYISSMVRQMALFVAALVLAPTIAHAVPRCVQQVRFRANPTLNLATVQRLAGQRISPETGDGSKLVVRSFDTEDSPSYGDLVGLALVYVTRGDLGENPVGGLLLQPRGTELVDISSAKITKSRDGVTFAVPGGRGCTPVRLHLSNNGTLTAQGVLVGRLRE